MQMCDRVYHLLSPSSASRVCSAPTTGSLAGSRFCSAILSLHSFFHLDASKGILKRHLGFPHGCAAISRLGLRETRRNLGLESRRIRGNSRRHDVVRSQVHVPVEPVRSEGVADLVYKLAVGGTANPSAPRRRSRESIHPLIGV